MSTLTRASTQWATRPQDEKFSSLADLHQAALGYRERARKAVIATKDLHPVVLEDQVSGEPKGVGLNGKTGVTAPVTHWAFGQLARIADAPAEYLRGLPAPLAVQCLEAGIANPKAQHDPQTLVLLDQNGSATVRALTSTRYTRIFNSDVTARLIRLSEERPEWQPAPAAFDGARGLYLGDRDMFAFLVDNDRRIFEKSNGGLSRGFFVENSEVGASSFVITTFLYEYVCGNHIVWGAKAIRELRLRHVGANDEKAFNAFQATVVEYMESSAEDEEALIGKARSFRIAEDKDSVLDKVFGLRQPALTRKVLEQSYALSEQFSDWYGDPRTAWAVANGITQYSQSKNYANQRNELDRAAGRVLDMAF